MKRNVSLLPPPQSLSFKLQILFGSFTVIYSFFNIIRFDAHSVARIRSWHLLLHMYKSRKKSSLFSCKIYYKTEPTRSGTTIAILRKLSADIRVFALKFVFVI